MEHTPSFRDFIRAFWRWFKRNFGNIVLVLILLTLFAIADIIDEVHFSLLKVQWDLEMIRTFDR